MFSIVLNATGTLLPTVHYLGIFIDDLLEEQIHGYIDSSKSFRKVTFRKSGV